VEGWPLDEIVGIVVVVVAAPAVAAVEDKDE